MHREEGPEAGGWVGEGGREGGSLMSEYKVVTGEDVRTSGTTKSEAL